MSNSTQSPQDTSVLLLAAGRGERMMPLTAELPKPLLKVGPHSLIEHHLLALQQQGFKNIVINLAYLGDKIRAQLADGAQYGLNISYSDESSSGALETAGGIANALPLIKSECFIVINADIWTDYTFSNLLSTTETGAKQNDQCLGKLVLIDNPEHNPAGDFALQANGLLGGSVENRKTFSGIALYRREVFSDLVVKKAALAPLLHSLIDDSKLSAEHYKGIWIDVGTPERLSQLNIDQQSLIRE